MEINTNEEEFYSSLNVSGIFSFGQNDPIESWLHNSVKHLDGYTISLPVDWVQVVETNKHVKWPLFTSLTIDRLEKEKLSIPVAAFKFWEQKDFGAMLREIMDKSAFYKFCHEEEKSQGFVHLLLEMFKIRRTINILHENPEKATNTLNSSGTNQFQDTGSSRSYATEMLRH